MDKKVAERMTEHVEMLAKVSGVRLHWILKWKASHAYPGQMVASVPKIRQPSDYLICLHEIGHCASPEAQNWNDLGGKYAEVLCEGAAWAWAADKALPSNLRHLRAADWDRALYAFRTHLAG